MASLELVLGANWRPPEERHVESPEVQLHDAMVSSGLTPPDNLIFDGQVHRFASGTKGKGGHGDKTGFYVAYADNGTPAGHFGCWRADIRQDWRADIGRKLSMVEEVAISRRISEAKAARDADRTRQHEIAASTVETIWSDGIPATAEHPYIARKGIQPHGARVTGDGRLMVPLYDEDGKLSSIQYIGQMDGEKRYHPGSETKGKFWQVGVTDEPGVIYIAEGFATACSINETTERPCVIAYSAGSLPPVTEIIRRKYGMAQEIVIVADNDASGVGQKYAEQASAKYGARIVMPPIEGDANDYRAAGNDLLALLEPPADDWLIHADEFSSQPAPISWLIKKWLQADAMIMVHGPSGCGKTFVVLDWCLRMAAGVPEWFGQKVRTGNVVYLAGEGHHGLRGRVAAWKHYHKAGKLKMWLSKDGCDLNTHSGYMRVVLNVRKLPEKPRVIVVDTLHRFLSGDENSAQDAKTMLDACAGLMREFGCSVILVHHTGVSDEVQHRARGSSAWRGALDIEISIVPGKNGQPLQIVQRKSKDADEAEAVFAELQSVEIPGWFDEDGETVYSAILLESNAPVKERKESKTAAHIKTFENAWWATGTEIKNNAPYITRSALLNYLTDNMGVSEQSAKTYIKPSRPGRLIFELLNGEIIENHEHGWIVIDNTQASAMMMRMVEK